MNGACRGVYQPTIEQNISIHNNKADIWDISGDVEDEVIISNHTLVEVGSNLNGEIPGN